MERIRKNIRDFDRFSFYKRACKAIDEGNWNEARINLEFLIYYVDICENEEKRQKSSLK